MIIIMLVHNFISIFHVDVIFTIFASLEINDKKQDSLGIQIFKKSESESGLEIGICMNPIIGMPNNYDKEFYWIS